MCIHVWVYLCIYTCIYEVVHKIMRQVRNESFQRNGSLIALLNIELWKNNMDGGRFLQGPICDRLLCGYMYIHLFVYGMV